MANEESEEIEEIVVDTSSPLDDLQQLLGEISDLLRRKGDEKRGKPFRAIFNNWSLSPFTYDDLADEIEDFSNYLGTHKYQESESFNLTLGVVEDRIRFLKDKVLSYLAASVSDNLSAVRVFNQTLSLSRRLIKSYETGITDRALQKKAVAVSKKLNAVEIKLNNAWESLEGVEERVERIIKADEASSNLPVTLNDLVKAKDEIQNLRAASLQAWEDIGGYERSISDVDQYTKEAKQQIESISARCDEILLKSTGVGLAAAFDKRAKELRISSRWWILWLMLSLGAIVLAAYWRSSAILILMQGSENASSLLVLTNYIISIISIGAPIWLAWLATKQIGYNFRLMEDYAFKASISQAYEGFRREAHNQNHELEEKILESIITRYDQEPLRYVASSVHGSPIHELLNGYLFKNPKKGSKERLKASDREEEEEKGEQPAELESKS